jgi:excisionase family DNA binding protein
MEPIQLQQEREIVQLVEQVFRESGPFVSLAEAARITGVPLATLADAVRNGRIPALRVQPRRWLVRISAVRTYFEQGNVPPDLALQQRLLVAGLLDEIKVQQKFEPFTPIPFTGQLASERLIEERR